MKLPLQASAVVREARYGSFAYPSGGRFPASTVEAGGVRPSLNYICCCDTSHSVSCPVGKGCHFDDNRPPNCICDSW